MSVPLIHLNDNNTIPQIGLGTWQITDEKDYMVAFNAALENGYRHFDTAQAYKNEQLLGAAISSSGKSRQDFFITTKIFVSHFAPHKLEETFKFSLEKLKTDYVDMLLLHFPVPLMRKNAWLTLEKIKADGKAKSIGVSNYTIKHLTEMEDYANEVPAVNQVELHVFLQQPELIEFCKNKNIAVEAYSPLARAHELDNPIINDIAKKHSKTYAQIMLRWLLEQDLIVIPKSINPIRIKENIELFNFKLDDDDMAKIKKLDFHHRYCWSPERIP